jgi:resuscitation-promoting factor RpfB
LLRSVKYGLYGAVLAAMVGGTVAWTTVDKTVSLVVDGQSSRIHTTAADVGAVLDGAGYHVGVHDIVAPSAAAAVADGSTIVYARGRLLRLDVNGARRDVWTTAPTVADAMAQLGYSRAVTSVSRSLRLPLGPTDISVRTPKLVTIVDNGRASQVTTTDATVGALLADLEIAVGPRDTVSPARTVALTADAKIVIKRVERATLTTTATVPFPTRTENTPALAAGQSQLVTPGRVGLKKITYAVVYVDGVLVGKTTLKAVLVRAPTAQLTEVGVQAVPPGAAVAPGTAQDAARTLLATRGWGRDQFSCLVSLWNQESGWNVHAANASGAYGIPQALPGSKMSSAGGDWRNSAATQISWGLGYIASRYGTPCGAWSSWQAQGWY